MKSKHIPFVAAMLTLMAHLAGNAHYGFFRDELYFIMCGMRPDWGYVDQPPLAPLLAAGTQLFGHSLFLLRVVPALFSAGSAAVTCLIAAELGGGLFAQILAALVAVLCPVLMIFGTKVSTDMVALALWPLAALWMLRALREGGSRYWLGVGLILGIAFQAKYSVVFFAAALMLGVLVTRQRRLLWNPWILGGLVLGLFVALPNLLWQLHYDLPMLELLRGGQAGKNVRLGAVDFLVTQVMITGPLLAPVWIIGFCSLLRSERTRFLGIAFVALIAEMIILHGKHYYPAAIYPVLIAAGAVTVESWTLIKTWLRPALMLAVLVVGLPLVPYVMPILPVDHFISYNAILAPILHLERLKSEHHRDSMLPPDWADMFGWPELALSVANVVAALPAEDRERAVILASNYGEAAALEFFGAELGLPPVISGHNQYFLWGTRGRSGQVVINVNGDCGKSRGVFKESHRVATFSHPYVMPYEDEIPISVCRDINQSLAELWPRFKLFR